MTWILAIEVRSRIKWVKKNYFNRGLYIVGKCLMKMTKKQCIISNIFCFLTINTIYVEIYLQTNYSFLKTHFSSRFAKKSKRNV